MSDGTVETLNERERACLAHVRQAQELGMSFSQYCREKDLKFHQWMWVKRALMRKGVISGRRRIGKAKAAGFATVRVAPSAVATTACRILHPSGWTIECASLPAATWMSALLLGELA